MRIVLAWALVIAMPVQGMAASVMLFCGPSHERMLQGPAPAALAQAPGHAHHPLHDDGVTAHGHHHDAGDAAAPGPMPHHGDPGCSVCAACCSMPLLPAQFAPPPVVGPAHPVGLSPAGPITSHQPERLDRPPRTVLA